MALTKTDLDMQTLQCGNPNCTIDHSGQPMFLSPSCHPQASVQISYIHGILMLSCPSCKRKVMDIKVAEGVIH